MPYTWEDFRKDFTKEHLHLLAPVNVSMGFLPMKYLNAFL